MPSAEEVWTDTTTALRRREGVPAAQAAADLLDRAKTRWDTRVAVRSSMHDLVFSRLAEQHVRAKLRVRVSWQEGVFEFRLTDPAGPLITADRSLAGNALVVLDSFLFQLAGEPAVDRARDG